MSLPLNHVMGLVAPLALEAEVEGWRLVHATSEGWTALYTLQRGSEQIVVGLEPRNGVRPSLTRTARWNVVLRSTEASRMSESASRAVVALIRAVKRNESAYAIPTVAEVVMQAQTTARAASAPSTAASRPRAPLLWLVPGHLGDPLDVSVRAIQVMAASGTWFVEAGKRPGTLELLASLGVSVEGHRIVEIELEDADALREPLQQMAARGEDGCLFGVNEGIPGFVDPGSKLIAAAGRCDPPIGVRSIGGASVLGNALMRIDRDIVFFTFLGHAGTTSAEPRFEALYSGVHEFDRPVIFFARDDWYRENGAALGAFVRRHRGTIVLLGDLTLPEESATEWNPRVDLEPPPIAASGIVVFLLPRGQREYS